MTQINMASSQNDPRNTQVLALLKTKNLRVAFVAWLKSIGGDANLAQALSKLDTERKNRALDALVAGLNEAPVHETGADLPDDHVFNKSLEDLAGGSPVDAPVPPIEHYSPDNNPERTSTIEKYTADSEKADNPIVDHPDVDDRRGGARESGRVEDHNPRAALDALGVGTVEHEEPVESEEDFSDADTRTPKEIAVGHTDLEGFREHLKETKALATESMMNWDAYSKDKITQRLEDVELSLKNLEGPINVIDARLTQAEVALQDFGDSLPGGANNRDGMDIAAITASITHAVLDEVRRIAVTAGDLEVLINLINKK